MILVHSMFTLNICEEDIELSKIKAMGRFWVLVTMILVPLSPPPGGGVCVQFLSRLLPLQSHCWLTPLQSVVCTDDADRRRQEEPHICIATGIPTHDQSHPTNDQSHRLTPDFFLKLIVWPGPVRNDSFWSKEARQFGERVGLDLWPTGY